MAHLDRLRRWRAMPPPGVTLGEALCPARVELAKARRARAALRPERAAVPPTLLSMAELLPIASGELRIRPLHASARAAWSSWLRDGGELALIRSSGGAFRKVRLVASSRVRSPVRVKLRKDKLR